MAHHVLTANKPMRLMSMVILVAACGGGAKRGPTTYAPSLQPKVGELQWYRAVSTCAQGPFEVDVPATGNKWGEEFELRLSTPRKVALHAVVIVDDKELAKSEVVVGRDGRTSGAPDNSKCVADARERLVLGRPGTEGGGTTPGTPVVPGRRVPGDPVPDAPAVTLEVADEPTFVTPSTVIHVRLDTPPPAGARVRIRFWSIEPNDLTGVLFGAVRIAWRPTIPDAEYEAYLVRVAQDAEMRRVRMLEEERRRAREYRPPAPDPDAERRAREQEQRDRERAERDRLRAEEAARRKAIEAALEAERARRRREWCDAHHESRDCWGAGGYKMKAQLDERGREREAYCAANPQDARCWTSEDRAKRRAIWDVRITQARTPPPPPDGPPPAALADPQPPRLSENATWRPGYWHWLDGNWVWLAGQWRVPDSDIEQERTTRAPSAPPPPQPETITVAPTPAVVWVSGFWMWNNTQWIWVPGSWQMRPSTSVRWRAPEWRVRGSVHILVPGGWSR